MAGIHTFPVAVAEQPIEDNREVGESNSLTASEFKSWVREILDWVVKLLPVIATILLAVLADHYKATLTASTLLSEREKADSQLRTEMFSRLVDPISGAKSGADVSREREQLLAELLSLNFHEHIGLKPLLSHVDGRLARESVDIDEATAAAARLARQSFRSVVGSVIARQTAMLTRSNGDGGNDGGAQIQKLDIGLPNLNPQLATTLQRKNDFVKLFNEPIELENPAHTHSLFLTVREPNWDNETFRVEVGIFAKKSGVELAKHDFQLSWFDFPLTDNTLLADGTRFAIVLDQIYDTDGRIAGSTPDQIKSDATKRVRMSIVWFPKDYIAARERPTNYREFRKSLGLGDS
jgi:hypothetical protein